jgi:hypothetical protein
LERPKSTVNVAGDDGDCIYVHAYDGGKDKSE